MTIVQDRFLLPSPQSRVQSGCCILTATLGLVPLILFILLSQGAQMVSANTQAYGPAEDRGTNLELTIQKDTTNFIVDGLTLTGNSNLFVKAAGDGVLHPGLQMTFRNCNLYQLMIGAGIAAGTYVTRLIDSNITVENNVLHNLLFFQRQSTPSTLHVDLVGCAILIQGNTIASLTRIYGDSSTFLSATDLSLIARENPSLHLQFGVTLPSGGDGRMILRRTQILVEDNPAIRGINVGFGQGAPVAMVMFIQCAFIARNNQFTTPATQMTNGLSLALAQHAGGKISVEFIRSTILFEGNDNIPYVYLAGTDSASPNPTSFLEFVDTTITFKQNQVIGAFVLAKTTSATVEVATVVWRGSSRLALIGNTVGGSYTVTDGPGAGAISTSGGVEYYDCPLVTWNSDPRSNFNVLTSCSALPNEVTAATVTEQLQNYGSAENAANTDVVLTIQKATTKFVVDGLHLTGDSNLYIVAEEEGILHPGLEIVVQNCQVDTGSSDNFGTIVLGYSSSGHKYLTLYQANITLKNNAARHLVLGHSIGGSGSMVNVDLIETSVYFYSNTASLNYLGKSGPFSTNDGSLLHLHTFESSVVFYEDTSHYVAEGDGVVDIVSSSIHVLGFTQQTPLSRTTTLFQTFGSRQEVTIAHSVIRIENLLNRNIWYGANTHPAANPDVYLTHVNSSLTFESNTIEEQGMRVACSGGSRYNFGGEMAVNFISSSVLFHQNHASDHTSSGDAAYGSIRFGSTFNSAQPAVVSFYGNSRVSFIKNSAIGSLVWGSGNYHDYNSSSPEYYDCPQVAWNGVDPRAGSGVEVLQPCSLRTGTAETTFSRATNTLTFSPIRTHSLRVPSQSLPLIGSISLSQSPSPASITSAAANDEVTTTTGHSTALVTSGPVTSTTHSPASSSINFPPTTTSAFLNGAASPSQVQFSLVATLRVIMSWDIFQQDAGEFQARLTTDLSTWLETLLLSIADASIAQLSSLEVVRAIRGSVLFIYRVNVTVAVTEEVRVRDELSSLLNTASTPPNLTFVVTLFQVLEGSSATLPAVDLNASGTQTKSCRLAWSAGLASATCQRAEDHLKNIDSLVVNGTICATDYAEATAFFSHKDSLCVNSDTEAEMSTLQLLYVTLGPTLGVAALGGLGKLLFLVFQRHASKAKCFSDKCTSEGEIKFCSRCNNRPYCPEHRGAEPGHCCVCDPRPPSASSSVFCGSDEQTDTPHNCLGGISCQSPHCEEEKDEDEDNDDEHKFIAIADVLSDADEQGAVAIDVNSERGPPGMAV